MSKFEKKTVGIVVPKRPEFGNAYWALQRKFETGLTIFDVETEAQYNELKADPVIEMLEGPAIEAALEARAATEPKADGQPEGTETKPGKPMKR